MIINSIEISLREPTATISLFAGCGGSNVSSIVCADSKEAVSEYKKLSKSHNPKLWEENRDNLLVMNEVLMPVWQDWDLQRYYPQKIKRFDTKVNLSNHPMIGRAELMHRIIRYFRSIDIPVGRSFTGDPEVWIPSTNRTNPWNAKYFDKFVIRPRYQDQSAGWELHITHSGVAKVCNQSMSVLPDLPDRGYSVMIGTEVLSVSKMARRHRRNQHIVYPVANHMLRNIIKIAPHYDYDNNKLVTKYNLIDWFAKTYILIESFKDSVGIDFPTGMWMNVHVEDKYMVPADARYLEYAEGYKGVNPMSDLSRFGPYRLPMKRVKFIMIFQKDDNRSQSRSAMKLFNGLTYGVDTDEDIRIKDGDNEKECQDKCSKQQERAYQSMSMFIGQPFSIPEGNAFIFNNLSTAVEEVRFQLEKRLKMKPEYTYEAVYISPIKQDDANSDALIVYYMLKEMLMERGIMLQAIYCQNPYSKKFRMFIPNLSVAMFAKADGIPYVIHKPYGDDDLIIGVGAYCNQKVGQRYVGSAICFDNKGMLQSYNCWPDCDTDRLKNSIKQGIMGFIKDHGHNPKRVIIHYYKTMSRKEARPITKMLYNLGLQGVPVFVLNISKTESEDLIAFDTEEQNMMPESGTVVNLNRGNYLLFNNSKYSHNDSANVLYPVKIRISKVDQDGKSQPYTDEESIELLTQVYQFSRLSYKTVKQQNMPVTTLYPELAARIVPFFNGRCIPEAGRKKMGFL